MEIIDLKKQKPTKVINQTIKVLKNDGLAIYPTETCYGAGVDSTNKKAVQKLLAYKGKRANKAIAIACADQKMASHYVKINQTAQNLYTNFLPGPLTVISKSKNKVVQQLESENKTLGIRIPDHRLTLQLIKAYGKPITATSANTSGNPPPYSISSLLKYTSQKAQKLIDLVLDAGQLKLRPVSSVVDTTLNEPKLLRQGKITLVGCKDQVFTSTSEKETKIIAAKIFNQFKKELANKCLIFALQGQLGAGKTQFIKGVGQALDIKENIASPTYILLKEYHYQQGMLYHIDTWRMETAEELANLGFVKMIKPDNVICIEWLEKVKSYLEKISKKTKVKLVWITIDYLNQKKRKIKYK
jgi:L-threonylcarbamoyladenylate synthase